MRAASYPPSTLRVSDVVTKATLGFQYLPVPVNAAGHIVIVIAPKRSAELKDNGEEQYGRVGGSKGTR